MKFRNFFFLIGYLLSIVSMCVASPHNQIPKITHVAITRDINTKDMVIAYDLQDTENDSVKVNVFIVTNTAVVEIHGATGDAGYPIMPGRGKRIIWNYRDFNFSGDDIRIKIVADDLKKVAIEDLLTQVDTNRIYKKLSFIAANRHHGTKKGEKHLNTVRDTIASNFNQYGLKVSRQSVPYGEYIGQNMIGKLQGLGQDEKFFIITAHYDTEKKSVGADDNGSGIVGLLEVARVLSRYNFNHSIQFVGFDLEEEGWIGSKQFAFNGGITLPGAVEGVINYDMIGVASDKPNTQIIPEGFDLLFPEVCAEITKNKLRGDFAVCTSNKDSEGLGASFTRYANRYVADFKVVNLMVLNNGEFTSSLAASDHVPFWRVKCKALHIGDGGETRNQFLDTSKDQIGLINFTFLGNIVKATIATVAELCGIQHSHVSFHTIQNTSSN